MVGSQKKTTGEIKDRTAYLIFAFEIFWMNKTDHYSFIMLHLQYVIYAILCCVTLSLCHSSDTHPTDQQLSQKNKQIDHITINREWGEKQNKKTKPTINRKQVEKQANRSFNYQQRVK